MAWHDRKHVLTLAATLTLTIGATYILLLSM
jgi:hypothetical protein